jgi:hypothetical protein
MNDHLISFTIYLCRTFWYTHLSYDDNFHELCWFFFFFSSYVCIKTGRIGKVVQCPGWADTTEGGVGKGSFRETKNNLCTTSQRPFLILFRFHLILHRHLTLRCNLLGFAFPHIFGRRDRGQYMGKWGKQDINLNEKKIFLIRQYRYYYYLPIIINQSKKMTSLTTLLFHVIDVKNILIW